jgi:hypothetical protein
MSRLGGGRGYLTIDHRNSPGIPDSMAPQVAAMGGLPVPGGVQLELDTWTCAHCNAIVVKRPGRTRPREVCRKCMAVVCDSCVLWCEPFTKIAEAIVEGKYHNLNSPLLVPGKLL